MSARITTSWRYQPQPIAMVDPAIPIGPLQPVNVLMGQYNLTPGDMPSGFQFQLDGEATNGLVSRNDTDPNYGAYLKAWQRVTGYRRVFVRTEAGNQASAIQSFVSLFRTPDGAVAALNFNRDRLRNLPAVALTDGPFGANSYLVVDRSNGNAMTASLVWADANVLASVDLSMPPRRCGNGGGSAGFGGADASSPCHRHHLSDGDEKRATAPPIVGLCRGCGLHVAGRLAVRGDRSGHVGGGLLCRARLRRGMVAGG